MAQPGGDHVDRDPCEQQSGGVQVAKIMKPCVREALPWLGGGLVVAVDQLRDCETAA
jgi:hypothetical protein